MSAELVGLAAMEVHASTHLDPSTASVHLAIQGCCVRTPQCPVSLPHVEMVVPVGRVVMLLMTVLAFLVSKRYPGEVPGDNKSAPCDHCYLVLPY